MRKKQANLYIPDKKIKETGFLTKQELRDFESQFTLFNREINLGKLKEAMINQNYHHACKPVFNFVDKVSQQQKSINFNEYMNKMTENLNSLNQGQLITQMLDQQNKGEISKQTLKQILQQALGRQILSQEMNSIMLKLFDTNSDKVSTDLLKKVANSQFLNSK